jgi:hypothetical protein
MEGIHMPNDLDTLMSRIATINAKSAQEVNDEDITALITYYRHLRSIKSSGGGRALRPKSTPAPANKLSLDTILSLSVTKPKAPTSTNTIVRRI